MVKLNAELKEEFAKMKIFPLATASKAGVPNVIPIGMCMLQDDCETIWIVDNYFNKTLENMKENPQAAIYVWGPDIKGCFQIKGKLEIVNSGADYEKMYKMVKEKADRFPARHLVRMKITEVFDCKSGPEAGKKIL